MKEVWAGHSLAGRGSRNRTGGEANQTGHVSGEPERSWDTAPRACLTHSPSQKRPCESNQHCGLSHSRLARGSAAWAKGTVFRLEAREAAPEIA